MNEWEQWSKWLIHWIGDLISDETIKIGFDNWIKGSEYRYNSNELNIMRWIWSKREKDLVNGSQENL